MRLPDGSLSSPVPFHIGVRQGCPASPILFNLFVNDVVDSLKIKEVSMYLASSLMRK